jgi:hypothetical protein
VVPPYWATWLPFIHPLVCAPCHARHMAPSGWCHMASPVSATWHFFTGPRGALKRSNSSDMWQPLVLPHVAC